MVQHVNVKIFAASPEHVDLAAALTVFHRWIREDAVPELVIDVADYRHVPAGPGVMLIGHEANYSLDNRNHRLGLLYNRKAPIEGDDDENIGQALGAALAACRRLESEPEFDGALRFDTREIEITMNDRLLAPNTGETFEALRPHIERSIGLLARAGFLPPSAASSTLERLGDARELLRIAVHGGRPN